MYHDDGTFKMGMYAAIAVIIGFFSGYGVRDMGFIIRINQQDGTPTEQQVQK